MEGKSQEAAAASAGMSVRTARKWDQGVLPSEAKRPRGWRTRSDPFAAVWESDVEPLLRADQAGALQATTILELLESRYPGQFGLGQLRTLQRRVRDWRALRGPEKEVFFPQQHVPGREAQVDFTHAKELGVTITGDRLDHLLFEFVLSYSRWRWVGLAFGETFEALVGGLQEALWSLGGVPEVIRTDNLSAATHELKRSGGRALNVRFAGVLDHYGLRSTRISPGKSHENGVVEQAHYRMKSALEQALLIRGHRDFASTEAYEEFVQGVVARLNARVAGRLEEERIHLRDLPAVRVPSYSTFRVRVRKWSTIRVSNKTYSVASRLIGHEVEVRQHADWIEVFYTGRCVEQIPRLRGDRDHRIDYRHVIWSLVRKPGAFARYRYREELFPSMAFRRAYDALRGWRGDRADIEYVRILHLAASTLESEVERALQDLLERRRPFDYVRVRELAAPVQPTIPEIAAPGVPDLTVYDELLSGVGR